MAYDYSKLRGKIIEKYRSQSIFAKRIGWSERTLSLKLNGKVHFTQMDIETFIEALGLDRNDIQSYFFSMVVQ